MVALSISRDTDTFLSQIVVGDETWDHHFEPEGKRQRNQWKRATSPPLKKSKDVHTSSGKVMMSFLPQGFYGVSGTGNHHQCPALSTVLQNLR
ncbi:hypothetical protein TNCV_3290671 [Trichonephila clavipes]|nr:hypothetical protein TNCV_3290671 [Trichonephila clavipes]